MSRDDRGDPHGAICLFSDLSDVVDDDTKLSNAHAYVLETGTIALSDGRRQVVGFLGPGDFLGLTGGPTAFSSRRRSAAFLLV